MGPSAGRLVGEGLLPEPSNEPRPTVGRIVHYTNLGDRDGKFPPEVQAAIITGLNPGGSVALHVFYRNGGFDMPSVGPALPGVEAGTERARGCWTWPPRV